jgi:hypothetical protein
MNVIMLEIFAHRKKAQPLLPFCTDHSTSKSEFYCFSHLMLIHINFQAKWMSNSYVENLLVRQKLKRKKFSLESDKWFHWLWMMKIALENLELNETNLKRIFLLLNIRDIIFLSAFISENNLLKGKKSEIKFLEEFF